MQLRSPVTFIMAAICLALPLNAVAQTDGQLPPGIWRSEGYGYIVVVKGDRAQTFDVTSTSCVRGPRYTLSQFRSYYGDAQDVGAPGAVLVRSPTRDHLERLDSMPTSCRKPLRSKDAAANLGVFTQTFEELYPFFEQRIIDWPAATQSARKQLGTSDLYSTLETLVRPLNDDHVAIDAGKRSYDPDTVNAPGVSPDGEAWSWRTLRASLRDYLQGSETPLSAPATLTANRRVLFGRMDDGIGYIAILAEGGWAEGQTDDVAAAEHTETAANVMDEILNALGDVRGVVVDLRANSGGFDAVAMEVTSRFADERRLAFRKGTRNAPVYEVFLEPSTKQRFTGPVAVLIGENTVSAGETAALAFAALPNAKLIGQPTRGSLSDAVPKTLPNGWTYTLSVETVMTPDGETVEVRGVKPDIVTAAPASNAPGEMWGRDLAAAALLLSSPGEMPGPK